MVKTTLIVSLINFLSLLLSFVLNIVISSNFGVSYQMDCYNVASTFPNYIVSVLLSVLSYTFIPVFAEYKVNNSNEGWKIANTLITIISLVLGLIILASIIYSVSILKIIAPGYNIQKILYTSSIFNLIIPIIFFTCLNELIASLFYSNGEYLLPLLNKLINPILTISFIIIFKNYLSVKSIVYANLVGSIIQFLFLWKKIMKYNEFKFKISFDLMHPGVKKIILLMLPLLASTFLYKFFPIYDAIVLSKFPDGTISSINYSNKLQLIVGSILTSIFSIQIFTLFSELVSENKMIELKNKISSLMSLMLYISIPLTILLFLFSQNIVEFIFERGTFNHYNTLTVSYFFKIYILALPIVSIASIISQGLYSLQSTKSIMIVGFSEIILYSSLIYFLQHFLESKTIPIVYVINFYFASIILGFILRNKIKLGGGLGILKTSIKSFFLSIIFYLFIYFIFKNFIFYNLLIVSLLPLFFLLYILLTYYLNFKEAHFITNIFFKQITKLKSLYFKKN